MKLHEELSQLKTEMTYVYKKLNQLEDCSLERNLILHGIEEGDGENEDICNNKIHGAIAPTINRDSLEERLQVAKEVELIRTRHIGRPDLDITDQLV